MQTMSALQAENAELRQNRTTERRTPHQMKTKHPDRPLINANIDDREWELIKDTWNLYKMMTGIQGVTEIRNELRASCSEDVNKFLFEFVGAEALNTATEDELLEHIRAIAVKTTHKEVHRMNFGKLFQSEGESITHFVARLRSQATLCKFSVQVAMTCDHDETYHAQVSFSDEMISQQLITGLFNQDHQSKILSEVASLPTLREKINRLQVLETTQESASMMKTAHPPAQLAATHGSQYKRSKKTSSTHHPKGNKPIAQAQCHGCGKQPILPERACHAKTAQRLTRDATTVE